MSKTLTYQALDVPRPNFAAHRAAPDGSEDLRKHDLFDTHAFVLQGGRSEASASKARANAESGSAHQERHVAEPECLEYRNFAGRGRVSDCARVHRADPDDVRRLRLELPGNIIRVDGKTALDIAGLSQTPRDGIRLGDISRSKCRTTDQLVLPSLAFAPLADAVGFGLARCYEKLLVVALAVATDERSVGLKCIVGCRVRGAQSVKEQLVHMRQLV